MFQNQLSFPAANCYWCGMNMTYFIPTHSLCHDAFESSDNRLRAVQRFFRGKCYYTNPIYVNLSPNGLWLRYFGNFQGWSNFVYGSLHGNNWTWGKWGKGFYFDYGLKRNYFGQYKGGCFKRYLDVGNVYTQRGCRHYWPKNTYGMSAVGHRFKKLELALHYRKDACVSTNHASLTPYNRGISLFTRYHVCVCSKRYCNRADNSARLSGALFSVAVLLFCRFNI